MTAPHNIPAPLSDFVLEIPHGFERVQRLYATDGDADSRAALAEIVGAPVVGLRSVGARHTPNWRMVSGPEIVRFFASTINSVTVVTELSGATGKRLPALALALDPVQVEVRHAPLEKVAPENHKFHSMKPERATMAQRHGVTRAQIDSGSEAVEVEDMGADESVATFAGDLSKVAFPEPTDENAQTIVADAPVASKEPMTQAVAAAPGAHAPAVDPADLDPTEPFAKGMERKRRLAAEQRVREQKQEIDDYAPGQPMPAAYAEKIAEFLAALGTVDHAHRVIAALYPAEFQKKGKGAAGPYKPNERLISGPNPAGVICEYIRQNADDRLGFYYSPHHYDCDARKDQDREFRTGHALAAITCLFVDVDYKDFTIPPEEVRKRVIDFVDDYIPPTAVVETGGGLQILWTFDAPIMFGGEERDDDLIVTFRTMRDQMLEVLGGDTNAKHDTQLMRLPYGFNTKPGRKVDGKSSLVTLHERNPRQRYKVENLELRDVRPDLRSRRDQAARSQEGRRAGRSQRLPRILGGLARRPARGHFGHDGRAGGGRVMGRVPQGDAEMHWRAGLGRRGPRRGDDMVDGLREGPCGAPRVGVLG